MDKKKAIILVAFLLTGISVMAYNSSKKKKLTNVNNSNNSFGDLLNPTPPEPSNPTTDFSKDIEKAINETKQPNPNNPDAKANPVVVVVSIEEITKQLYKEMSKRHSRPQNIMALLSEVSQEDFSIMVNIFGKKPYDKLYRTDLKDSMNGKFEDANLKEWLITELPPEQYNKLKQKYPKYL